MAAAAVPSAFGGTDAEMAESIGRFKRAADAIADGIERTGATAKRRRVETRRVIEELRAAAGRVRPALVRRLAARSAERRRDESDALVDRRRKARLDRYADQHRREMGAAMARIAETRSVTKRLMRKRRKSRDANPKTKVPRSHA
jgi:hypothetical protein